MVTGTDFCKEFTGGEWRSITGNTGKVEAGVGVKQ